MGGMEPEGGAPTTNGGPNNPVAPAEMAGGAPGLDSFVPPTKKDISLREFLGQMDEYAPIVRLNLLGDISSRIIPPYSSSLL